MTLYQQLLDWLNPMRVSDRNLRWIAWTIP